MKTGTLSRKRSGHLGMVRRHLALVPMFALGLAGLLAPFCTAQAQQGAGGQTPNAPATGTPSLRAPDTVRSADHGVSAAAVAPSRWQPALAHAGQKARLLQWWGQWNDPLLVALIDAAQNAQPTLKSSLQSIARVHDLLPPERPAWRADAANWEASIADAAHGGAQPAPGGLMADADWHPARVAIAAETAEQYVGWLYCRQKKSDCSTRLRALSMLTGLSMEGLSERLLARSMTPPNPTRLNTPRLRTRWLEQRPDVAAAMLDVERARIEIARAEVQRHPRLQLLGEIGSDRAGATGTVTEQEIVGPTQTMPPFDAQRMQAVLEARQADYLAAASELRSRAREAAREAEQGVSALLAAQARSKEAWLEQAMAWIHLYRVVGGGWSATPTAGPQR